jgi:hypothetical protein
MRVVLLSKMHLVFNGFSKGIFTYFPWSNTSLNGKMCAGKQCTGYTSRFNIPAILKLQG